MFVGDVADDELDQILHRDQAVGAAVFVDDEREVNAGRLHLGEQIERRHRRRRVQDFAHDLGRRQRHRQIDVGEVEIGRFGASCSAALCGSCAARDAMNAIRSRMWTMPVGSSSVSL